MSGLKPAGDDIKNVDIVLTIIITCYNTRDLVADCLASIYQNPPSDAYEIFLVDDGSSDGTSEMVRAAFPEVRLLRSEVNRHYAHSNNWALDHARGRYVLLLNNDTIVLPRALDDMVNFLREHLDAGTVGCRLLNEDGSIQWSVKSLPNPVSALVGSRSFVAKLFPNNRFSREHLLHINRDMTEPFVAGYVSSAASMMPLSVMKKVGRLDPLFAYHIDADYCKRISDAGYKNYYLPTATIIHLNHRGGHHGELAGALPISDDVRSSELPILSQTSSVIALDPDVDRRRGRPFVSLSGAGLRAGLCGGCPSGALAVAGQEFGPRRNVGE